VVSLCELSLVELNEALLVRVADEAAEDLLIETTEARIRFERTRGALDLCLQCLSVVDNEGHDGASVFIDDVLVQRRRCLITDDDADEGISAEAWQDSMSRRPRDLVKLSVIASLVEAVEVLGREVR